LRDGWIRSFGTASVVLAISCGSNSANPADAASSGGNPPVGTGDNAALGEANAPGDDSGAGGNDGGNNPPSNGSPDGSVNTDAGDDAGSAMGTDARPPIVDARTPEAGPRPPPGPVTNTVGVDPTMPSATPVPDDFLGVSTEWTTMLTYLGNSQGQMRPEVVRLLRNFEDEGHHVVMRLGGNSADRTYWAHMPSGLIGGKVPIHLVAAHFSTIADLHRQLPSTRMIIGLNLVLNDPNDAAQIAGAVLAQLPVDSLMAFELGNEPDLYSNPSGNRRGSNYNFSTYNQEVDAFHDGVLAALPATPALPATRFAAPALAGGAWLGNMKGFFQSETTRLTLATTHVYAGSICSGTASIAAADLLTDTSTVRIANTYAPHVRDAHGAGLTYRMAEMNTASCAGIDGVSNVYASALWTADIAFQFAAIGMDGLNFHTPGNAPVNYYAVFDTPSTGLDVRPLYYGMRLFSLGTAQKGRLVPVTVTGSARVKAWATLGSDNAVRVVLINEDLTGNDSVKLQVPARSGAASLIRLVASGIGAKTGVSLGMQTWDGSTDGAPVGALTSEALANDGAGNFVVPLPALHAVVVTVP
jgi:hypothetical protein